MNWTDKITVTNEDCMELMGRHEDGYFDLAIVDPPYGIMAGNMTMGLGKKQWKKGKQWDDSSPDFYYFKELFRVSKNQIIWGGNYFTDFLHPTNAWIFWDKEQVEGISFSDGELAWTSFNGVLKKARVVYSGFRGNDNGGKIHPTQKPVALYNWLLDRYAKPDFKILDTHLGSGSHAIACHYFGCELVACELDSEYYEAAHKRFKTVTSQQKLF